MRKSLKKIKLKSNARNYRRKLSIRKKIIGSTGKPRICANASNKHLSVQVIDDSTSSTIFSLHTFGKKAIQGASNTKEGAKVFGVALAKELKERGLNSAVFDRSGKPYTGILAELVTSIRQNGILI